MKNVLSIAGSDSSGGAGIQADLKTMCAMGVYGMTAVTAVTAQNTREVTAVQDIGAEMVESQLKAVFEDIRVDAVKVGMTSSSAIILAIARCLKKYGARNIVIDPVMVSKSGYHLLKREAIDSVRGFVAIADIVTPNIPEAELLCQFPVRTASDMRAAAERLVGMGAKSALIKGGHLFEPASAAIAAGGNGRGGSGNGGAAGGEVGEGSGNGGAADGEVGEVGEDSGNGGAAGFCQAAEESNDLLLAGGQFVWLPAKRVDTKDTHGTGCTLSSAIACRLALGDSLADAVLAAKAYITQAISDSYAVGKGAGPVGHMTALYRRAGMASD